MKLTDELQNKLGNAKSEDEVKKILGETKQNVDPEQDEGGVGEKKRKQKLQCLYEQSHPFISTLSHWSF